MNSLFLYILLFIIPTYYCELIPNNKVTKDFSMVEGIPYYIIHSKTNSKLVIDGVNRWFLTQVNGSLYNIMGLNRESKLSALDSNNDNVYTNPRDNNNVHQRWKFEEVKDHKYIIVHNKSGRNLDSDGSRFYISSEGNNCPTNVYQHWLFEPSNYNTSAVVLNFEYPPDLKDNVERYKTRTGLLSGSYIIENDSNATIEQTISKDETKLNSYTVEIRKSESFKSTKRINMSFNLGSMIFGLLGINTGFTSGIEREFSSYNEKMFMDTVIDVVLYHIGQKITVPPFTSVKINSTVDKITINVPFRAKIKISGKSDRLDEDGTVVEMANVENNAIRCFIRKENYDDDKINEEDTSLVINTNGTLKVDGYGLETIINAHKNPDYEHIPDDTKSPKPPSSGSSTWFIWLITIFIILLIVCVGYAGYKLYLRWNNSQPISL